MNTTIQIDKTIVTALKEVKEYPRQTYNELLEKMIRIFRQSKKNNIYNDCFYRIQQNKMKDLWDNKEDGFWQNV